MHLDLLAGPATGAGRRLALSGLPLLQRLGQAASPLQAMQPAHAGPGRHDDAPPPDDDAALRDDPDATELLLTDEHQLARGSRAAQRLDHRQQLMQQAGSDASDFRVALRDAHQARAAEPAAPTGQSTAATTPAKPDPAESPPLSETPSRGGEREAAQKPAPREANEPAPQPRATRPTAPAPVPVTAGAARSALDVLPRGDDARAAAVAKAAAPTTTAPVETTRTAGPVAPTAAGSAPGTPRPSAGPTGTTGDAATRETASGQRATATSTAQAVTATSDTSGRDGQQQQHADGGTRQGPGLAIRAEGVTTVAGQSAAAELDPADRAQSLDRIVRVVQAEAAAGNSRVVMQLSPPELGNLRIQMNLRRGQLDLRVRVENDLARRLLEGESAALRGGLRAAGMELGLLEVQSAPPSQAAAGPTESSVGPVGRWSSRDATVAPESGARQEQGDTVAEPRLNVLA